MKEHKKEDLDNLLPPPEKRSKCFWVFVVLFGFVWCCFLCYAFWYFDRGNCTSPQCSAVPDPEKFDCHPEGGVSQSRCEQRGCCYKTRSGLYKPDGGLPPLDVPYCFYPSNYVGYTVSQSVSLDGRQISAKLKRNGASGFPNDVQNLHLVITFIDDQTVRIKITDADSSRFEVPIPINDTLRKLENPLYDVQLDSKTGELSITRKSSGAAIFKTDLSRLVYADQFLQLSSYLPSPYFYGIGEKYGRFLRDVNWTRITLLNSDQAPVANKPLYGTQPFYLSLEKDGNANGVFLRNSNPMDVILQPTPAVTFRPIGGILDFFVLLGPSPANVIQQYTSIVGRTFMPPYWSLGFQLCRFGYKTLNKTRETMQRNIDAGIPLDVQWNDIDYMDNYKDFTYDKDNFKGLPEFVDDLHKKGMHYVIMTDPGLSSSEKPGSYAPYDEAIKDNVLIKNPNGTVFVGKVWTDGGTAWPDFSHPNATAYWSRQFSNFYKEVKYDGVWIDMNEPSNFLNGGKDGCPKSSFEDPVYVPGGSVPLRTKTVCMTAKHYKTIHYNEHNLLGIREATATNQALRKVRNKRPFIISRASFAGQGAQSGHWSGDVFSTFEDMRYTIPSMLNFNMYGISMTGSDICGFNGNTTVQLCARWQMLGAFYPFARNHNERVTIEQDPVALGRTVVEATIEALAYRYFFLPYLYTLFYRSHVFGETVIRPLAFEYPLDPNTYSIDEQFLWGSGLMVIPALYPNVTQVSAYLPKGLWYNTDRGAPIVSRGENISFPLGITEIGLLMKSGHIFPAQNIKQNTTQSRTLPFILSGGLDENQEASGELFWDDGDSLETYERGLYTLVKFTANQDGLNTTVEHKGYTESMNLSMIMMLGLPSNPSEVSVNGVKCLRKVTSSKVNWLKFFGERKVTEFAANEADCVFQSQVTSSKVNGLKFFGERKVSKFTANEADSVFRNMVLHGVTIQMRAVSLLSPVNVVWKF